MEKKPVSIPVNPEQMQRIFTFIDATQPEETKRTIFGQLGAYCFECAHQEAWIAPYRENFQSFLDWVNVEHASTYWESLVFSADWTHLILTGRVVDRCVCGLASVQPPLALCQYCCKHYQEKLFAALLGRAVEVEITASFLRGDDRCDTIIKLV